MIPINRSASADNSKGEDDLPSNRASRSRSNLAAIVSRKDDTVDEMANALLDDTPITRRTGSAAQVPHQSSSGPDSDSAFRTTLAEPMDGDAPEHLVPSREVAIKIGSPLTRTKSDESDESLFIMQGVPTPEIPHKSSRRNITKDIARVPIQPSIVNGVAGLRKSQTIDLNPLGQNRTNVATTAPSFSMGELPARSSNPPRFDRADALIINEKIASVLAATAALKGEPQVATKPAPTLMNRLKSTKLFSKFSNAVSGRFHRKKSEEPRQVCLEPLTLTENESQVSAIDMRLNEGQNLNFSGKMQEMTGTQVERRPLHDNGKALRAGDSVDDPFSEVYSALRPPTNFESRLKGQATKDRNEGRGPRATRTAPPVPMIDPFKAEHVMDSDIDDLLPTPPVAASTPKSSRYRIPADRAHLQKNNLPTTSFLKSPENEFLIPQRRIAMVQSLTKMSNSSFMQTNGHSDEDTSRGLLAKRRDDTG